MLLKYSDNSVGLYCSTKFVPFSGNFSMASEPAEQSLIYVISVFYLEYVKVQDFIV